MLGDDGAADGDEVGLEEREEVEALGVAEAGVVLDEADAVARGDEAAVEDAAIGLVEFVMERGDDLLVGAAGEVMSAGVRKGSRTVGVGVGAHAAGVGAAVAVEGALVVLHGGHVAEGEAVGEGEERELFAFELFFDDEGMACGEELVAEGEGFGARGEVVAEDLDAFAAGEAVVLDDVIVAEAIEEGFDAVERGEALEDGVAGDVVAIEERAREGLGGLDARERLRGADGGDAGGPECVGDTGGERSFGADDGECGRVLAREGEDGGGIGDVAGGVGAGERGDAGVARCCRSREVQAAAGCGRGRRRWSAHVRRSR